jgi:hypothetical protein
VSLSEQPVAGDTSSVAFTPAGEGPVGVVLCHCLQRIPVGLCTIVLSMSVLVVSLVERRVTNFMECRIRKVRASSGVTIIWRYCGVLQMIATLPTYINVYLSLSKSYTVGKNAVIGCASVMRRELL